MASSGVPIRRRISGALFVTLGLVATFALSTPAEARKHKHGRSHHARQAKSEPYRPAFAAYVIDVKTGKTLYAKSEDEIRYPASITKVMTLYLLFEQLDRGRLSLDSPLRVSANAASQAPSKLGVRPGSTIEVEDAIKAVVTRSANDVAVAIGENLAGSEPAFARMMTAKARALGMASTVYVNASGLPDERQVTTARDLSILARAIQDRFPRYYGYFSTRSFRYGGRVIGNHNRLIGRVEGVDGIKTGYTRMSGFNLMTSAKANGRHVVGIVLGGRSGAIRDRIMASLIEDSMPRAYAGARQTPMVGEGAPVAMAAAARDAEPEVAPREATREVPKPARAQLAPRRADIRPVVASANSLSTTTPSAFRWVAPRQERVAESQALARLAYAPDTKTRSDVRALGQLVKATDDKSGSGQSSVAKTASKAAERADDDKGRRSTGGWVIQLGATEDEAEAEKLLASAKGASAALKGASPFTEKVVRGSATLYRARFSGFDPDAAQAACKSLKRSGFACFAIKS
ncbi:serine hydrolase [Chelatococcus reniformis]|uniref:Penicillin-binding protein n=1 Tax=Chelatococcus reniformis TaxID=1494448 RepID=A0A916U2T0_9HYPH|nr:serine hydrolase [Chelatococcus reniformis]GGC57422.1 penicillin-binding protein [Chelatococcus reniformis]